MSAASNTSLNLWITKHNYDWDHRGFIRKELPHTSNHGGIIKEMLCVVQNWSHYTSTSVGNIEVVDRLSFLKSTWQLVNQLWGGQPLIFM